MDGLLRKAFDALEWQYKDVKTIKALKDYQTEQQLNLETLKSLLITIEDYKIKCLDSIKRSEDALNEVASVFEQIEVEKFNERQPKGRQIDTFFINP